MCRPDVDLFNCLLPSVPDLNPSGIASNLFEQVFNWLSTEMVKSAVEVLELTVTSWVNVSSKDTLRSGQSTIDQLMNHTQWLTLAIMVTSFMIAGGRIALQRNGQEAGELAKGVAWLAVLSAGGAGAMLLVTEAGDLYTEWILNAATSGKFNDALMALPGMLTTGITSLMAIFLLIMLISAGLLQMLLFFARNAALIFLVGLLPLAGAIGMTSGGQAVRRRYVTWLISFALYKPVAGTIYAGAFWMMQKGKDLTTFITGVVAMCMAIVALPALMRLISPVITIATSGWNDQGSGMGRASSTLSVANGAAPFFDKLRARGTAALKDGPSGSDSKPPSGTKLPDQKASGSDRKDGMVPGPDGVMVPKRGGGQVTGPGGGISKVVSPAPSSTATAASTGGAPTAGAGGAAAGGAASGAAAAVPIGAALAAVYMVAKAPANAVRKIGATAASGIDEADY
ncbi:hypothetical protein Drose_24905 [Dactylosporangium roseum]|uniref:TrbL/VirB6 plasmid conjugal transfer protein n=1 Tax=Dactylosporangium roseum TaxID=47989 RepID=A0ABY5YYI7_9ACTN|nr:hypothetical protein [Dactylosporangium roseum]UWZ34456.1 hypothetical protein Drose_24905 [Dactylosporangium roseum]